MRKKFYVFLLSVTVLGIAGCNAKQSTSNVTPTVTKAVESQKKEPTKTPTPSVEETNKTITVTNGLCEVLEQKDASLQASYNSFNRMLAISDVELGLAGQSIFCVDESTGVIYFANQGKERDNYLYRLKDGEAKLAVAMPMKEIYTYQGAVYFMIHNYDIYELGELHNGDIYCYTPADGMVKLVYEVGAIENSEDHRLTVNEKGIYFCYGVQEEAGYKYHYYHLPFGESEPIEDTEMTVWKGWDDYVFNYIVDESWNYSAILQSRAVQEDGTREIIETPNKVYRFCVQGDYLYSAERTYISRLNLKTGEETKYDFYNMLQEVVGKKTENGMTTGIDLKNDPVRVIESFTVTETDIWISINTDYLGRFNFETQEVSYVYLSKDDNLDEIAKTHLKIKELYTDGKDAYVACFSREVDEKGNLQQLVWTLQQPAWFARITDVVETSWTGDKAIIVEGLVE